MYVQALWSLKAVSVDEFDSFARRSGGSRESDDVYFIGRDRNGQGYARLSLHPEIPSYKLEDFLRIFKAFDVPPLSYFLVSGSWRCAPTVTSDIAKHFDGIRVEDTDNLPCVEEGSPDPDLLQSIYTRLYWTPGVHRRIRAVREGLKDQGWDGYTTCSTRLFVALFEEAQIRLYSPVAAFLIFFCNHSFNLKYGQGHAIYDFHTEKVLAATREQSFDLARVEAETGDRIVPVGVVAGSTFLCIGLSGYFYLVRWSAEDRQMDWQPIGENVLEAMTYLYYGDSE